MKKSKILSKCILFGVLWSIILVLVGIVIVRFNDFSLKDVLFIEGVAVAISGAFSFINGNPSGISLSSIGQDNAQYVATANLETSKIEKQKNNMKTDFKISLSGSSLFLGGIICIIISYTF
ncbi:hypothetical protein [Clostridium mediterraneense]|uniref:hypothetical protein n=1 Tax=Clostridium mediterraneense TaxID=1805472 RepID=UPI00083413CA|nr:hypothetical protein [Clostridium mediterraneense]